MDFAEKYIHFDNISKMSETDFIEDYLIWNKENGYQPSKTKALEIYNCAKNSIPTLDFQNPITSIMILESVRVIKKNH